MIYLVSILGLALGSFYLVIGTRLPKKEDIVIKKSHCDHCEKELKWYHLIPVFSYVFLIGKCAYCKGKINILNPIIEISTALLFAYVYYSFGISYQFFISLIIISLLIIICVSDFKYYIILDSPLIIGSILIIITQLYYYNINFVISNLISGLALFLFFFIVKLIGNKLFKKESLGGGDIKFAFVIGLILGFQISLFAIIISVFLALPTSIATVALSKNKEVPFGPFLVGALLLVFLNYEKFTLLYNYIIA